MHLRKTETLFGRRRRDERTTRHKTNVNTKQGQPRLLNKMAFKFEDLVGPELLNSNGKEVSSSDALSGKKHVMLYFR
jgi:hypothetical protein